VRLWPRVRAARGAASEVQGGSCAQVSPASTLLLHDNSSVTFTTLIIAPSAWPHAAVRSET
jgi:hypothetical protein